ncbi:MAG: hypothetical protein ACLRUY_02710 [Faecalibacterium prausnitzii]
MCEVLDRIENCGIDKGKAEGRIKGRTQVMALMKKLLSRIVLMMRKRLPRTRPIMTVC